MSCWRMPRMPVKLSPVALGLAVDEEVVAQVLRHVEAVEPARAVVEVLAVDARGAAAARDVALARHDGARGVPARENTSHSSVW